MNLSENEKEALDKFADEQKDEIDDLKKEYKLHKDKEITQLRELKKAVQELISFYARPSIEPHKVVETWRRIKELADC